MKTGEAKHASGREALLRPRTDTLNRPVESGRTRGEALAHPEVVTSITRRDYRCDVAFHAAMRGVEVNPRWSLDALAKALQRPVFTLCLGRRFCPLGAPLVPRIVEAEFGPDAIRQSFGAPTTTLPHTAETPQDLGPSVRHRRVSRRTDQPLDRSIWSFETREEWVEHIA